METHTGLCMATRRDGKLCPNPVKFGEFCGVHHKKTKPTVAPIHPIGESINESIFSDGSMQKYIQDNLYDPWEGTPLQGYVFLSPKQKGEFGERFVTKLMEHYGLTCTRAKTSTAGYDRVIGGIKTEIKFSVSQRSKDHNGTKENYFMINHVSKAKKWERLIFVGINSMNDFVICWMTKSDFCKNINEFFFPQQGGKKGGNDDYICDGDKVLRLIESPFMKKMSEWTTTTR